MSRIELFLHIMGAFFSGWILFRGVMWIWDKSTNHTDRHNMLADGVNKLPEIQRRIGQLESTVKELEKEVYKKEVVK